MFIFIHGLAVLRISGALQASTDVMQSMQQLLKVEDIGATMRELSQEMTKVSIYLLHPCGSGCQYCL